MQVMMHHLKTSSLRLLVVGKEVLSSFISLLITQHSLLAPENQLLENVGEI
jgi:hypothetical protein